MVEDFARLLFGELRLVSDRGDELGFGECFSHNVDVFRWLLMFGLVTKVV
jgi:hypothetical protein